MNLYYKKIGEGPAIVVLHGLFGMSDNWLSFAKRMANDFSFYLLDARNHGRSEHSQEMNYNIMAEDVKHFLHEHNINKPHLVGHSMGGKTAMTFAQKYPQDIEKLVILDIAPKKYKSSHFTDFISAMMDLDLDRYKSRREIEVELQKRLQVNPAIIQFLLKNLFRGDENNFGWRINLAVIKDEILNLLDEISFKKNLKTDTLFLKGGLSNYINSQDEDQINENFLNVRIQEVAQATHWVHSTAPGTLEKFLRSFFSNN